MHQVRIKKKIVSKTQSAPIGNSVWILEYLGNETTRNYYDIMGWKSSSSTLEQINITFKSLMSAVTYAKNNNLKYIIEDVKEKEFLKKNYSDNLK